MTTTELPLVPTLDRGQARLQLALNVSDLDAAVDFYERLFETPVTKRREGYANFAIANPPLKLVLIEGSEGASVNHIGVEVDSAATVGATQRRLSQEGVGSRSEEGVTCCYAVQDKIWISDPDGAAWEIYTVLEDAEQPLSDGCNCADADADLATACC